MNAHRYLDEIVDPTVKEYESEPTSVRRAMLACIATYHAIEYLGLKRQREEFWQECPDFALVDRICHAAKHVEGRHQPLRSEDVIIRPPGFFDVGALDLSRFDDPVGGVTIRANTSLDILQALKRAVTFLRSKIAG